MSAASPSEADPLLTPRQDHRQLSCCSCKLSYKPRKFSSKGAVLVLLWQFLMVCSVVIAQPKVSNLKSSIASCLQITEAAIVILVAIISGWLADTKVGRSRVVQSGLFLAWLGVVLQTVCNLLTMNLHMYTTSSTFKTIVQAVQSIMVFATYGGAAIFCTNIAQFGLEQMPYASSDAMTVYISWMAIVTVVGVGSFDMLGTLFHCVINLDMTMLRPIMGCTVLSIAICSKFLFSHWLIDHRQNHNPLKTLYRVLKFAKQHKYPVQRSAFTYWEEEIPSRIDLGKTKYGGPFTTEEVEDVKTFFRIVLVLTVISLFTTVGFLISNVPLPSYTKSCLITFIFSFKGIFTALGFLTYEYIIYPLIKIRYKLSMLKTIGLCLLYCVLMVLIAFVYTIATEYGCVDLNIMITKGHHSTEIILKWVANVVLFIFIRSILQFICSQAPEHMKGIFLVWTWLTVGIFFAASNARFFDCSKHKYCGVYLTSVALPFSVLVFVFYCCVARWYKWREREEPCNERAIIEEIYCRRVEHNSTNQYDSD